MESLGGEGFSVKDLKVGTKTADAHELLLNGHKTDETSATAKESQMARTDERTESSAFGLRDSDAMRGIWNLVKLFFGCVNVDTLADIRAKIDSDGAYDGESRLVRDLQAIRSYFEHSSTLYIASSVIIKWSSNRANKNAEDRAKLIDLAHPVRREEYIRTAQNAQVEFVRIRAGLVGGINKIL